MGAKRVLVVDDDRLILRFVQAKLKGRGIESETALSPEQAIEMMRMNLYHVVVADINMPGMNGVEMITALKESNPLVQIIMLTAESTFIRVLDCIDRGAVDLFSKIDDMANLIDAVVLSQARVDRWTHLIEMRGRKATAANA